MLYRNVTSKSADLQVPRSLLRGLGLQHHLIDCRKQVPAGFRELYERNALLAHYDDWGVIGYGIGEGHPRSAVCIRGGCSEVARCHYDRWGIRKSGIDAAGRSRWSAGGTSFPSPANAWSSGCES